MCRFKTITIPSDTRGNLDIDKFRQALQDDVALVMLTNPNTLGLFEENILEISDLAHKNGTLMLRWRQYERYARNNKACRSGV